jgi:hypothetical protein
MIHDLLLRLDGILPLYPPAMVVVAAILLGILVLRLLGRSRGTVLFALAVGVLSLGLAVGLVGVDRPASPLVWGEVEDLAERAIGPAAFRRYEQFAAAGLVLAGVLLAAVYALATQDRPGERARRLLELDQAQSALLGSAHLCNSATFRRWSEPDPYGWMLRGTFWGAKGQRLGKQFCLSGEDVARGVAVFGPQGSGKTQCVVLPAIADRMRDGHSLIVTDVQGELQPYIAKMASATGHTLVVHDPSHPEGSCALNLCAWIDDVADAQAVAAVLLSNARGGDPFWARAAANLLAACALHYPSFGAVLDARRDLHQMARELRGSKAPGAADLAADFVTSMGTQDPRLALNIMATAFNVGLAPWADPALRAISDENDLDLAGQLISTPTVLILRCARRHTDAYGPYLGTILRVLTSQLDDLGREAGGALPIPVGLILEEFPALGRLDSLVRDVNLVRKRRISVLTAAQSLAQFDGVYPGKGEAEQLLAGLATRIVFGGCDARTAAYFSELSGQQTMALASFSRSRRPGARVQESSTASLRGRALLLPDDLVRPAKGHATVFAAYGEDGRADQAIFHAQLAPFFRRGDWKLHRLEARAPLSVPARRSAPTPRPAAAPELESSKPESELSQDLEPDLDLNLNVEL